MVMDGLEPIKITTKRLSTFIKCDEFITAVSAAEAVVDRFYERLGDLTIRQMGYGEPLSVAEEEELNAMVFYLSDFDEDEEDDDDDECY